MFLFRNCAAKYLFFPRICGTAIYTHGTPGSSLKVISKPHSMRWWLRIILVHHMPMVLYDTKLWCPIFNLGTS